MPGAFQRARWARSALGGTMAKLRRAVLWACVIVLAAAFVLVGTSKLTGLSAVRWSERFAHWGFPARASLLVGVLEVLGGVGLLVARSRRAAAAALASLMVGAAATHLVNGEPFRVIPPLVLGSLAFVVFRWWEADPSGRGPSAAARSA